MRRLRPRAAPVRRGAATLDAILDQLPAFVWTTDRALRLTTFRGGEVARTGHGPTGRVGLTLATFFGTDDPDHPALAAHRRALAGEEAKYETARDGRTYRVRVTPLREPGGRITGCVGLGVDITEQRAVETALRASEARFRAIFEGAAIGIGLADLDRRPLLVNPALARFTGRDGGESGERPFPRSTHPADLARDQELYVKLVAGERDHYQIEKRYLRTDGATVWGRLTTSLVRDETGAPSYVIGMVEDITTRVAAEEALRASREQLLTIVENAPLILFTLDAAGVTTFAAGSGLATLGRTAEEVVGVSVFAATPRNPAIANYVRRALAGQTVEAVVDTGGSPSRRATRRCATRPGRSPA